MASPVRLPNFNHLYYFHVVATEGSLAKAARRLRVTQPTISAQIRNLEQFVGHRLFDRSGRGMRLTSKGEYVAARITEGGAVEPRFTLATKEEMQHRAVF